MNSPPSLRAFADITWRRAVWKRRSGTWKRGARVLPLWKLLGGSREEIECGVSIGIQPTIERLLQVIQKEVERGLSPDQDQDQAGLGC